VVRATAETLAQGSFEASPTAFRHQRLELCLVEQAGTKADRPEVAVQLDGFGSAGNTREVQLHQRGFHALLERARN
jgi:hypothetical protein